MGSKTVKVDGVGEISLYRRRGVKQIRLSVTRQNEIRVVIPSWAPYRLGVDFALAKADWIATQLTPQQYIIDRMPVGKAHHFSFVRGDGIRPSSRLNGNVVIVHLPPNVPYHHPSVQAAAKRAGIKALKREAEVLLPKRVATLAIEHGFDYQDITIKQLKGRWGSCSQQKELTFNCYLMQLPWQLIDYVIIHELVHTRIMAHGQIFWQEVGKYVSDLNAVRRQMREFQPDFFSRKGLALPNNEYDSE